MDTGKALLGILAGAAAGLTIGILFAPDKGSNTRRKISQKGEELIEEVKEKIDNYIDGIKQKVENLEAKADELFEEDINKTATGRRERKKSTVGQENI